MNRHSYHHHANYTHTYTFNWALGDKPHHQGRQNRSRHAACLHKDTRNDCYRKLAPTTTIATNKGPRPQGQQP
eukprot:4367223-Alexandrium_andersonii.AAC.1